MVNRKDHHARDTLGDDTTVGPRRLGAGGFARTRKKAMKLLSLDGRRAVREWLKWSLMIAVVIAVVWLSNQRDTVSGAVAVNVAEPRSPQWPAVRAAFLETHPVCEACGSKGRKGKPLQVHHVIPFRVDPNGDDDNDGTPNELDHDNLMTLCVDGVGHTNCHLMFGHAGSFRCHNPTARRDAKLFREMLAAKLCDVTGSANTKSDPESDRSSQVGKDQER